MFALDPGWATVVAGLLALAGGAWAGISAWKSLTHALKRDKAADERRKLNLFLKAEHMAYNLTQGTPLREISGVLTFSPVTPEGTAIPRTIPATQLHIPRPAQLAELWNYLSDFPPEAIHEIRAITRHFDAAEDYLGGVKDVPDGMRSPLVHNYNSIRNSAIVLREIMSRHVEKDCHEIENRDELIYGVPDSDELAPVPDSEQYRTSRSRIGMRRRE